MAAPRACKDRVIHDLSESTPVIVGVDGSERSADALALANVLAPALGCPVLIAFVHAYGRLSSLLSEGDYERMVREVAESTFAGVLKHLPSVTEPRMQLATGRSPAAGLHALAERERATLVVIGSSHRSRIGRILPGGTGERLFSGAPTPVAVAPAGYATTKPRLQTVGCGFDGSPESRRALEWSAALARTAAAQLRVIAVHEPVLPATLALGGGPPTASLNQVLRDRREDELAEAVAALGPDLAVSGELLDGNAEDGLSRASGDMSVLVLGSRGYGPLRAVLLGSVSSGLLRSASSPLVVIPRASDAGDGPP